MQFQNFTPKIYYLALTLYFFVPLIYMNIVLFVTTVRYIITHLRIFIRMLPGDAKQKD